MKRYFVLIVILTIFACSEPEPKSFDLTKHIPADTELFLVSPKLDSLAMLFSTNKLLKIQNPELASTLEDELGYLKYLNFKGRSGISFSNLDKEKWEYVLITKSDSNLVVLDSIQNKSVENIKQEGIEFEKIELEGDLFYLLKTGNTSLITNSKKRVLNFGKENQTIQDQTFFKALDAADPNKSSIIYNGKAEKQLFDLLGNFSLNNNQDLASWNILDLETGVNEIRLNGLSLSTEKDFIQRFQNSDPQEIEAAKIVPQDFVQFYSLGFNEYQNIRSARDTINTNYPAVLDYVREISGITLKIGEAVALNAHEIEIAKEQISQFGTFKEEYRDLKIYELSKEFQIEKELEFIQIDNFGGFYTIIDHFIIFSSKEEVLKAIISAVQNSKTLENNAQYNEVLNSLASESSLLTVQNLPEHYKKNNKKEPEKLKPFTLAAFQIIAEDNFSHVHAIVAEPASSVVNSGQAEQVASFKIEAPMAINPVFFRNHETDQMDIAVQDLNNTLYLISNKGTNFWKKKLDSKITSPVFQVDLFKNGNKQLAFSTGYHLEVLDRNGNNVKPFPKKFNDPLTQPLAVFDYDNNRTYRFVLTQGKKVYMLGPKGNAIKGFDFENAKSEIVKAPKHIRLGNKDYILIAEESGKLNILSRQGKIRVPVTENLNFSENDWYGSNSNFVSTEPDQNLVKITQSGTVQKQNLNLAENNRLVAEDDILVYLNENELVINDQKIALDFGLYTDPQIFQIGRKTYVSVTDTQAKKVYVYDKNGQLLPGFPIFGTSQVDIANADLDKRMELLVKGDEDEILLYKM